MDKNRQVCTQTYQEKFVAQGNRGIFTKKTFKAFETVMICQPIAMSVLSQYKNKMCNYCLRIKELNRCSQCKVFYYCSSQCQRNDWKIHKLQCKFYAKMLTQKKLSPLKQIHTQFALNIRCWMISQSDREAKQKIQSMVSLQQYQTAEKIEYFRQMGVVICENFEIQKNQENLGALLSIANRISINTFTIQDPLYNFDGIAIGLYFPANLLNHDCQANCTQIFDGRTLKILANKPIQKSTQLTISYTSILDDRNTRIQTLRTNYLFQCFCQLCQVQKMVDTETFYLLCPQCKQKQIIKQKKQNNASQIKCQNCEKKFKPQQIKELVDQINKHMEAVRMAETYQLSKKNFFAVKKMCDFNHPAFAKLIRFVYIQALNAASVVQGQAKQKLYEEAEILLNEELSKTKTWYRMDEEQQLNLVKIWQYAELGKLAYNLKKLQKAYDYTEKAMELAKYISYKQKFQELKDLEMRFSQIKIQLSLAKTKALK